MPRVLHPTTQAGRSRQNEPMGVNVDVSDEANDIEITGWFDKMMCFSSGQHLAMADVVGARLLTWDEAKAGIGWRIAGGYWPGRFATGCGAGANFFRTRSRARTRRSVVTGFRRKSWASASKAATA